MKKSKTTIIGHGESGHTHLANGKNVSVFEENNEPAEVEAPEGMEITHEEHKAIEIPAGTYRVGGVLEFDPAEQEARQVRD